MALFSFVQNTASKEETVLSDDPSHGRVEIVCGGLKLRVRELTPGQEAAYEASMQVVLVKVLPHARRLQRDEAQARRVLAVLETGGLEAVDKIPRGAIASGQDEGAPGA